ncbi:MAG: STAS domain-containing protein [SAR324 cluster bacterium]|nr:STAS domain-containing protein [SAR324 cluster bacterium]
MELIYRMENNICVVELEGELTLDKAYEFNNRIKFLTDEKNPKALLINMQDLIHMDSAGFGALATIYKTMKSQAKQLGVCQLNPHMKATFQITKLGELISIYDTEQEALRNLEMLS